MNNLREYFGQIFGGEVLEKKQKRFVLKKDFNEEEAFLEERETVIGNDQEAQTRETVTLHKLGCSHIVGAIGPQELIGLCDKCGLSICFRCGIRCSRCLELICPKCVRVYENIPFCSKCRVITCLKDGTLFSLRGIHSFFSKEF